jgi:membrane-bound inhibitor of C-type lysozyme
MGQTNMNAYRSIVLGMAAAGSLVGPAPVRAQDTTVRSYHCADGTNFIVGFFPYDKRAHIEIDGGAATLLKRLSLSGTRYSGGGVTLSIAKSGAVTIKHAKRPVTACTLDLKQ